MLGNDTLVDECGIVDSQYTNYLNLLIDIQQLKEKSILKVLFQNNKVIIQ